uniref:Uncharacterized protein n=1 Tax=Anthurium amnicola TaxID=1678845 RepID=A0A1D1XJG2_9ARAE
MMEFHGTRYSSLTRGSILPRALPVSRVPAREEAVGEEKESNTDEWEDYAHKKNKNPPSLPPLFSESPLPLSPLHHSPFWLLPSLLCAANSKSPPPAPSPLSDPYIYTYEFVRIECRLPPLYSLSLSAVLSHGVAGVRDGGPRESSGVQERRGGGAPQDGVPRRHLRHEHHRHLPAGDPRAALPGEAGLRHRPPPHQVLRRGRHPLHRPRPRPPRRLRGPRGLPGRLPPPMARLPLLRLRLPRRRPAGVARRRRGHVARRRGRRREPLRADRAAGEAEAGCGGGGGGGAGVPRGAPPRQRRPGGGGGGFGGGGRGGEAGEAEAEDGVAGAGDWDHIPLGDHRGDDGDVAEPVHDPAAGAGALLPPDLRRDGPRRVHRPGKNSSPPAPSVPFPLRR